ncbi:MAG TPA: hypothetical protein PKH39_10705, partial [Woeseiaceae bacterium]|nr:hypothetical protein [Woeseiaceae bacterium]
PCFGKARARYLAQVSLTLDRWTLPKLISIISGTVSIGFAAYLIPKLIFLLEQDDCLDSGGALNSAGICVVESGAHYSPLFGPQTPYFVWLVLFGIASAMIFSMYSVGTKLFDRLVAQRRPDDPAV